MKHTHLNRKLANPRPEGGFALRVTHRKRTGKMGPRYLVKCGCCDESVEIFYGSGTLEISGVIGTIENWREILIPLLEGREGDAHASSTNSPRD